MFSELRKPFWCFVGSFEYSDPWFALQDPQEWPNPEEFRFAKYFKTGQTVWKDPNEEDYIRNVTNFTASKEGSTVRRIKKWVFDSMINNYLKNDKIM